MAKVKIWGDQIYFKCPGCDDYHAINKLWAFNGDLDKPTFSPSILVKTGHYASGHKGDCWCTYNEGHPDKIDMFKCRICHSFVNNGKIQFLDDCTHDLKGQTIEIPEWEEKNNDD